MTGPVKYYRIKITKKLIQEATNHRNKLLSELIEHATDPVIFKRRLRLLAQLSDLESQLLTKIQSFETDNVDDFDLQILFNEFRHVTNRSS
jgi:hypothetical protein